MYLSTLHVPKYTSCTSVACILHVPQYPACTPVPFMLLLLSCLLRLSLSCSRVSILFAVYTCTLHVLSSFHVQLVPTCFPLSYLSFFSLFSVYLQKYLSRLVPTFPFLSFLTLNYHLHFLSLPIHLVQSSIVYRLSSIVYRLSSRLSSIVHRPSSIVHREPFNVHLLPSNNHHLRRLRRHHHLGHLRRVHSFE
jgi:hypothetical protein